MKLFYNYYFIILLFLDLNIISAYARYYQRKPNVLISVSTTDLYFCLHYISFNMVLNNTDTHLLQQQTKSQTIIYTVRNCNAVKNKLIIIYLLECRISFHGLYIAA